MNTRTSTTSHVIPKAAGHSIKAAILALALAFGGCGGGGGGAPTAVNGVAVDPATPSVVARANAYTVTSDDYGMQSATYLASTKSSLGIVLRAAIASSMTDQNFKTVSRIDIQPGAAISAGTSYSLGSAPGSSFPGAVYFLNGHPSTLLRTVDGTIRFTSFGGNPGDRITGSFSAVVEDGNDTATPKARYTVAADFDFVTDSFGPVSPSGGSDFAAAGSSYDASCAACHALGSHDTTTAGAGDLALKGGKLGTVFHPGEASHQGIRLAAAEISALQVLLNGN